MFLCLITIAGAQTTDLARVEYLNIPFSNSNNSIQRYRALVQVPIPINWDKKTFLVIGLEYRYVDLNIQDPIDMEAFQAHGGGPVSSVHRMDGYLGYTWQLTERWRLGAKVGVSIKSDLGDSPMGDDFIYDAAVYAIWSKNIDDTKRKTRLILGLTYSTTPGRNYPLPLVNLNKEFKPNWTYTIGVPKTNIRYYFNDSHKDALQAFITLDNFTSNIQQNFIVNNSSPQLAESISMTTVIPGLGYEHFFTKHLLYYAYGGHTAYMNYRLEDKDGASIYTINDENSLYFRTGIKFKY
jgi:hypothetical protein